MLCEIQPIGPISHLFDSRAWLWQFEGSEICTPEDHTQAILRRRRTFSRLRCVFFRKSFLFKSEKDRLFTTEVDVFHQIDQSNCIFALFGPHVDPLSTLFQGKRRSASMGRRAKPKSKPVKVFGWRFWWMFFF